MTFGSRRREGGPVDLTLTWASGPRLSEEWRPERVAVIAHWSEDGRCSRSLRTLATEFTECGFEVLVVSANERAPVGAGQWPGGGDPVSLYRRPNSGYDFGTWAAALEGFPGIGAAQEVILANDSMVGPFASLREVVERGLRMHADVWSVTDSRQFGWHPQSFFVGYRGGVLAEPALRNFWRGIRVQESKGSIIRKYELGLGRLLSREGYSAAAVFPCESLVHGRRQNPTIRAWRSLLQAGFPMVKRQLLTDPEVAKDSAEIADDVFARYHTDINDWL